MNKQKGQKIKTIQINYPAPYFHQSWSQSQDAEQKKKRVPTKIVSPYKTRNEVFVTNQALICPHNPVLTLEKAAKKLETITKRPYLAPYQRAKLIEGKKSPKKRANNNLILVKETNSPKPRKRSPRPSSPHLKYGVFRKPARMRGQTHLLLEKRRHRISCLPSKPNSPVVMYRPCPVPSLAVSEIVHLDIKPRQPSPQIGQGAAFSWRGATKAS